MIISCMMFGYAILFGALFYLERKEARLSALFGALFYLERKEARLSAKIALAFGVIAAIALGILNLIHEFKVN